MGTAGSLMLMGIKSCLSGLILHNSGHFFCVVTSWLIGVYRLMVHYRFDKKKLNKSVDMFSNKNGNVQDSKMYKQYQHVW